MSYITLKKDNKTFYISRNLQEKVSEELCRLFEIYGNHESEAAEIFITRMSDFIVNDRNEFVKCRHSLHNMIEVYENHLQWLRKVNDE